MPWSGVPEPAPCPLIAARFCEWAGGSRGAQRPRSGAVGALDAAARERIMPGAGGRQALVVVDAVMVRGSGWPFCAG